jgi:hypothetical protein
MRINDFYSALRAGRREALFLRIFRKREGHLLSLEEIASIVKPRSQAYSGIKTVPVQRIIGSEDRSRDFSRSFYPLNASLEKRWSRVEKLFLDQKISEAVKLIEYGGHYFVRDGNHRVSAAKVHGIEFIDAEIIYFGIPVTLPKNMSVLRISELQAKLYFQDKTGAFDYVPENSFGDAQPESWRYLADLIIGRIMKEMVKREGSSIDRERLITTWHATLFQTVMELISREVLLTAFPGRSDLDLFCDILRIWEALPGEATPAEAFRLFLERAAGKRRFPTSLVFHIKRQLRRLRRNTSEEREFFHRISRLPRIRPDAEIHEGGKLWYRFLTRQLVDVHMRRLRTELGHRPHLDELVANWYDTVYSPVVKEYRTKQNHGSFPEFFMKKIGSENCEGTQTDL